MYFVITKCWNIDEGWMSDFGTISHSMLQRRLTTIESFLYDFLARSRRAGTPAKIVSILELKTQNRFPFLCIRKLKSAVQAMR